MAQPTAQHLARLARIARQLEAKRKRLVEIQRLLETVERGGIVVDGEAWMLNELLGALDGALQMLDALQEAETTQEAIRQLAALESLLAETEWDLSDQIESDLEKKDRARKEMTRRYEDQIAEWQGRLSLLEQRLKEARRTRAPVIRQEREWSRLQALVAQAERALRDQQFGILAESFSQLEASQSEPDQLVKQINGKIEEASRFRLQADLLLLKSPLVDNQYQYTVLLRTPSEPGSHGINIQGDSTLVKQDRDEMSAAIDDVTAAINKGLARQFELRGQAAAQTLPAAAQAEAGVGPPAASDGEGVGAPEEVRHIFLDEGLEPPLSPFQVNDLARDVGDLMYRLFMPEQMQRYLHDTPCSVTITTNDLELPWELMCYQDRFLCLERPVARMPMGQAFPRATRPSSRVGGKLRFLLIHADPQGNLPAAGREVERIQQGLEKEWAGQIEIDVFSGAKAKGRELNKVLRGGTYDVIHYAGHAAFNTKEPELSGLLLHGSEVFFAQKIRRLLEGRPLVFLNACQSGRTANEEEPQAVEDYLQQPAEGLASSFIYGGALGCIGALWPIYDRPAAEFAVDFYSRVLEGYMIGEAMRQARLRSREAYPNQITWAAFVLYGDPTFRLVD